LGDVFEAMAGFLTGANGEKREERNTVELLSLSPFSLFALKKLLLPSSAPDAGFRLLFNAFTV